MGFSDTLPAPLSQGAGYGVLVGLGFGYCLLMLLCTYWLKQYNREDNRNIETFAVAGRKVGTGLTTTAVLASWLWPNAIAGSVVSTWNFGIAGSYWFGAGCIVQIAGFSLAAIQSKRRTPTVMTVLQVVKARYGTTAHIVFMVLCLANNLIAYVNMAIAASASITAITGVNTIAVLWLMPAAVCAYTLVGGLKSTFLADYLHTVSLLLTVLYLVSKTLASEEIGSIRGLYNLLIRAADANPVEGNREGSYLTLTSPNGLQFGVLHTLGNFGLVMMDSSYWQKAYAAGPANVVPGYLLAGLFYFAVPVLMGGVIGLAARGLSSVQSPIWPVKGRSLTDDEVNNGMPLAYTAYAVAGKGGSFAVLWLLYQAITSTVSAEFVASGSIVSQDLFHTYFAPHATERQMIIATHTGVVIFALVATAISIGLWKINLSLNWLLYMLGIITTPGMVPLLLTVLWRGQTKLAAIVAPLSGVVSGITVWLVLSAYYSGTWTVSVSTAGVLQPCMYGTIVASCVPAIVSPVLSLIKPGPRFEWEDLAHIPLVGTDDSATSSLEDIHHHDHANTGSPSKEGSEDGGHQASPKADSSDRPDPKPQTLDHFVDYAEKETPGADGGKYDQTRGQVQGNDQAALVDRENHAGGEQPYLPGSDDRSMRNMAHIAAVAGAGTFLIVWCLVPFALYGSRYIFSRPFFYGWVVVMTISVSVTLLYVIIAPPWEGRVLIGRIVLGVLGLSNETKLNGTADANFISLPALSHHGEHRDRRGDQGQVSRSETPEKPSLEKRP